MCEVLHSRVLHERTLDLGRFYVCRAAGDSQQKSKSGEGGGNRYTRGLTDAVLLTDSLTRSDEQPAAIVVPAVASVARVVDRVVSLIIIVSRRLKHVKAVAFARRRRASVPAVPLRTSVSHAVRNRRWSGSWPA